MATYRTTFTTATPIDDAFEYLARFSTTAEWDPGVVAAEDLTPGELRVGSAFQVTSQFGPSRVPLRYEIVSLERPVRVVLQAENWAVTSIDTITFDTTGEGTEITYHADLRPRGLARLASPILSLAFGRIGDRAATGLRVAVDRLTPSSREDQP
jgi:hypothetical protein